MNTVSNSVRYLKEEAHHCPEGPSPQVSVLIAAVNCAPYIATAIESALAQINVDVEVIVVDDASSDATAAITRGYEATGRVRVLVNQTNHGPSYSRNRAIADARAVVLPSDWYENAPMSVLESFAAGKPVVGARIGGIPEMIDETTGWTFESRDVEGLARVLDAIRTMDDRNIEDTGRSAKRRVERTFNRKRYLEEIQVVYSSLGVAA